MKGEGNRGSIDEGYEVLRGIDSEKGDREGRGFSDVSSWEKLRGVWIRRGRVFDGTFRKRITGVTVGVT